jgi:hypothetical protein
MSRSQPTAQELEQRTDEIGAGSKYRTRPVLILDRSDIHGFVRSVPQLAYLVSLFDPSCRYLLEVKWTTKSLHNNSNTTSESQISNKDKSRHEYLF